MTDCKFSDINQQNLSKLVYQADDIKTYLRELKQYFDKNLSNNDIINKIDELIELFESFTSSALSTKMSALSVTVAELDKTLIDTNKKIEELKTLFISLNLNTEKIEIIINKINLLCANCNEKISYIFTFIKCKKEPRKDFKSWLDLAWYWLSLRNFAEIMLILLLCAVIYIIYFVSINQDKLKATIRQTIKTTVQESLEGIIY